MGEVERRNLQPAYSEETEDFEGETEDFEKFHLHLFVDK
jgi:hypothetical protein